MRSASGIWIKGAATTVLFVAAEIFAALASAWWGHPGLHNLIWFLGIAIVAAFVGFKSADARALGVLGFIFVGVFAVMAAAYFLPSGYR
jgi:hypothetical protein